ncbi:hypothetical protein [Pelagicoccus sp. SDUM812002]|uniref:hypothetical protein n=1 Tax=Pelagicoccus sp. SDUM812002 TaxID=3041266 RepID=UPI00280F0E68|nr:hypothetical protein [Pelagicoccus sp. SDUM812002]MDQ8184444.1 hypothetical protein [Pelagicoccus sp. SDUM812002]
MKVIKLAYDITDRKMENTNSQGQIGAVGKAQAVIEFELDGSITKANENFLMLTGYKLAEIRAGIIGFLWNPIMPNACRILIFFVKF